MQELKPLQEEFLEYVVNPQNSSILKHLSSRTDLKKRFSIYQNTTHTKLIRALEITFPRFWKMVGKECADNAATAFLKENHWPHQTLLNDWGSEFPDFVKTFTPLSHLIYLGDLLQLDWLHHLSYQALEFQPLLATELQYHFENNPEQFTVTLQPSVFLFESEYGMAEVLDVLEDKTEHLDLEKKPSYALISKQEEHVIIQWIESELFLFLKLLTLKKPLIDVYEQIVETLPSFDINAAMGFVLEKELLRAFETAAIQSK
jgi:hypothetical protein